MKHCHLSNEAFEWINGELLGDGSLACRASRTARFVYSSKHFEYINYVSDTLAQFGIMQCGKIHRERNCYHYTSLTYTDLFDVWIAWYVYGSKQVPKDLELTPIVCRQWYIGDGSLRTRHSGQSIFLYTMTFPVCDVKWLIEQLKSKGFLTTRHPSTNSIHISAVSTKEFLNYIGSCPVKCYKYKWKVSDDYDNKLNC